ncbi:MULTISPECIES: helix-turn-helix transcriptional regulator [unclassified Mesorhizobium]|uniref:helix-turn-helix domain-containing protein n=1 Tax=unclassified Mesorhizobium TaxID=325217 RepID=UPI0015E45D6F|nr:MULTISPECIES: helix-turn-helix transcriptional regulator [unclassified Mesorhizobium]
MAKRSDFRPVRERIDALPAERRAKIEKGAAEILRAVHLSELRKAMSVTQMTVAARTGLKQAEVSRIEKSPASVQIKTMERYVRGLGGDMKIVAEFPDGTYAEIPLSHGKPVRSKITTETKNDDNNYTEERLGA